jgi:cell division protease FtsH
MRFLPGPDVLERDYSEETARAIDAEVKRIVEGGRSRAVQIIESRRGLLDAIAAQLLARETLERADLEQLVELRSGRRPAVVASAPRAAST